MMAAIIPPGAAPGSEFSVNVDLDKARSTQPGRMEETQPATQQSDDVCTVALASGEQREIPCLSAVFSRQNAQLRDLPVSLLADDGCRVDRSFTAGHIALVKRGKCTFAAKALHAQASGASGLLVYNQQPKKKKAKQPALMKLVDPDSEVELASSFQTLGNGSSSTVIAIPVVALSADDGDFLAEQLGADKQLAASVSGRRRAGQSMYVVCTERCMGTVRWSGQAPGGKPLELFYGESLDTAALSFCSAAAGGGKVQREECEPWIDAVHTAQAAKAVALFDQESVLAACDSSAEDDYSKLKVGEDCIEIDALPRQQHFAMLARSVCQGRAGGSEVEGGPLRILGRCLTRLEMATSGAVSEGVHTRLLLAAEEGVRSVLRVGGAIGAQKQHHHFALAAGLAFHTGQLLARAGLSHINATQLLVASVDSTGLQGRYAFGLCKLFELGVVSAALPETWALAEKACRTHLDMHADDKASGVRRDTHFASESQLRSLLVSVLRVNGRNNEAREVILGGIPEHDTFASDEAAVTSQANSDLGGAHLPEGHEFVWPVGHPLKSADPKVRGPHLRSLDLDMDLDTSPGLDLAEACGHVGGVHSEEHLRVDVRYANAAAAAAAGPAMAAAAAAAGAKHGHGAVLSVEEFRKTYLSEAKVRLKLRRLHAAHTRLTICLTSSCVSPGWHVRKARADQRRTSCRWLVSLQALDLGKRYSLLAQRDTHGPPVARRRPDDAGGLRGQGTAQCEACALFRLRRARVLPGHRQHQPGEGSGRPDSAVREVQ
jgi:hypothetical protein